MFSEIVTFFLDAYHKALESLSFITTWLKSLVTPSALFWYAFGLLTAVLVKLLRIRYGFWRIKSRIASKVTEQSDFSVSSATKVISESYPRAPIEMRREEIENISDVLVKVIQLANRHSITDWNRRLLEVDPNWAKRFVSDCLTIQDSLMQEALARAFLRETIASGQINHQAIDILAATTSQDWRTFTAICSFTCNIGGRITPVIFNFEDEVYRNAGLGVERLASLIASGLITQGGTGDIYTLVIPEQGLSVKYFDEDEMTVRPLSGPIPRTYLGMTTTRPHPLDTKLNVGVLDFTHVGRTLGFVTPCSKVDAFTEYLRSRWEEYLHVPDSMDYPATVDESER